MKKRKMRIRWGRVCVAGIILMLVLKLLASVVMTAFEKRYEELQAQIRNLWAFEKE